MAQFFGSILLQWPSFRKSGNYDFQKISHLCNSEVFCYFLLLKCVMLILRMPLTVGELGYFDFRLFSLKTSAFVHSATAHPNV